MNAASAGASFTNLGVSNRPTVGRALVWSGSKVAAGAFLHEQGYEIADWAAFEPGVLAALSWVELYVTALSGV